MELKLKNGDYVFDGVGGLRHVTGQEELLQRVLFRLCVRRGAFPFLPTLGSRLYQLSGEKTGARAALAEQYVIEALSDEEGLSVEKVELSEQKGDAMLLVALSFQGQHSELALPLRV